VRALVDCDTWQPTCTAMHVWYNISRNLHGEGTRQRYECIGFGLWILGLAMPNIAIAAVWVRLRIDR